MKEDSLEELRTQGYSILINKFEPFLRKFLSNKIIPLYIFDGGTVIEKENTNIMRYQKKII